MNATEMLADLKNNISLYASFDASPNADIARGDGQVSLQAEVARHDPTGGRFGGALVFSARDYGWAEDECTFASRDNFPYQQHAAFDGTVSLWLKGDPDVDLSPEYPVDPFHVSRHAADASYYVDLTRPNDWRYGSPRKLRFGFYNDSPAQDMFQEGRLIVIGDLNWNDGAWHHIVATWENSNSGELDGRAAVYIDGRLRGWMDGYKHHFAWDADQVTIGLGQRYVGAIDEFLILDRALTAEQVAALHALEQPLARIVK
ncbi:MAG: hypothetical protein O3A00_22360 [Planctomycetota bacterium]|nr:hypothetical protein [Planctomycetota bacterium]